MFARKINLVGLRGSGKGRNMKTADLSRSTVLMEIRTIASRLAAAKLGVKPVSEKEISIL